VPQRSEDHGEHIGQPGKPRRRVISMISHAAYLRFCRALLLPSLTESNPCQQRQSVLQNVTLSPARSASSSKLALVMPKAPPVNSTIRRHNLAVYINLYGDIMPVACRNCRVAGLVCRVHVRLGRCNECNRRNLKSCNIRISENEWVLIRQERERLQARLGAIKNEEAEVQKALQENAERAAEAISVEEAGISLLEQQEATAGPSDGLALSPFTWSLMEGLPDDA
jgi:hypothetical protein